MNRTNARSSPDCSLAEIGQTIEFYTDLACPNQRHIGNIKNISHKYLTIYYIVPEPGLENLFPQRNKKIIILTRTFITKVLNIAERKEKHASRHN